MCILTLIVYSNVNINFHQFNSQQAKNECVQVVVRCRPMSKKEISSGNYENVVDVFPTRGVIEIRNPSDSNRDNKKMFTYDAVYDDR